MKNDLVRIEPVTMAMGSMLELSLLPWQWDLLELTETMSLQPISTHRMCAGD